MGATLAADLGWGGVCCVASWAMTGIVCDGCAGCVVAHPAAQAAKANSAMNRRKFEYCIRNPLFWQRNWELFDSRFSEVDDFGRECNVESFEDAFDDELSEFEDVGA